MLSYSSVAQEMPLMSNDSVMVDWQELQRRWEDDIEASWTEFRVRSAGLEARLAAVAAELAAIRAELAAWEPWQRKSLHRQD
jgi:hypothetical protein